MSELNIKLRYLIASACEHLPKSQKRQEIIGEVHILVTKSGKLWKEITPYYDDALQEMWASCLQHPEEYDPTIKEVITWLNDELKKILRRFRDGNTRQRNRIASHIKTEEGVLDPVENLASPPDIEPTLEILYNTLNWVKTDPDEELRKTCFRKRAEINAQALFLRRITSETPWEDIAAEFKLTPPEAKDLPKFYSRKCLPLLRKFGLSQGYIG
jgi:hypothetical protein